MGWNSLTKGISNLSPALSLAGDIYGAKAAKKEGKAQRNYETEQARLDREIQGKQFEDTLRQRQSEFGKTFEQGQKEYQGQADTEAARQRAYQNMLTTGGGYMQEGEGAFLDETGRPLPELEAMKADIASGNTEAMQDASSQMQAQLAQQGMRGGQASKIGRAHV